MRLVRDDGRPVRRRRRRDLRKRAHRAGDSDQQAGAGQGHHRRRPQGHHPGVRRPHRAPPRRHLARLLRGTRRGHPRRPCAGAARGRQDRTCSAPRLHHGEPLRPLPGIERPSPGSCGASSRGGDRRAGVGRSGSPDAREAFIRGLPKAELHLHIEGTLEPELMLSLGAPQRRARALRRRRRGARRLPRSPTCSSFLEPLLPRAWPCSARERDFFELTEAYLEPRRTPTACATSRSSSTRRAHLGRGVSFDEVVTGISGGARRTASATSASPSRLIMCFLRDESRARRPRRARTRRCRQRRRDRRRRSRLGRASAIRRASSPRSSRAARDAGFAAVAHAGEEGPAGLHRRGARRAARGSHRPRRARRSTTRRSSRRLRRERVPLTMCPLSNLRLGVVGSLAEHPLKRLLDAGVAVTVNSDDPAYFGGYLVDNYLAATATLGLTRADIATLARNSITGSLLPGSAPDGAARRDRRLRDRGERVGERRAGEGQRRAGAGRRGQDCEHRPRGLLAATRFSVGARRAYPSGHAPARDTGQSITTPRFCAALVEYHEERRHLELGARHAARPGQLRTLRRRPARRGAPEGDRSLGSRAADRTCGGSTATSSWDASPSATG